MEGAAAFVAWLGISLVVVSDGRWGLALGMAVAAAGLAALALPNAGAAGAIALAAGGLGSAVRRATSGPPGWGVMPPGSTARVVLCLAGALLALWTSLSLTFGAGAALRFGVFSVIGLAAAKVLSSDDGPAAMSAVALMPLAAAAAVGLGGQADGWVLYAVAGAIAAASPWVPFRTPRAA